MAESKRAPAEEPVELDVKFDAEAYVRRELINARAAVVLVIYGVLLGDVGTLLSASLRNQVAALGVFFLGMTAVKGVLEVCGVSTGAWDRKAWAGHVGIVFFTFLAAWVLLQNPPFVS
jgi:uncharacterized membrane protein HdeD (DUF308 family)